MGCGAAACSLATTLPPRLYVNCQDTGNHENTTKMKYGQTSVSSANPTVCTATLIMMFMRGSWTLEARSSVDTAPAHRPMAIPPQILKLAAGEVLATEGDSSCCPSDGSGFGAAGEAEGGFQQYAAAVYEEVQKHRDDPEVDDPEAGEAPEPPPPDGGAHGSTDLTRREQGAGVNQPQPPQPLAAPAWPLPPPLVLPPGRDLALPRLRVCGNPRCGNFRCEGEWALPLKQCGGCGAVRYCGADCQRAHWREGHKAECKALAAWVASR